MASTFWIRGPVTKPVSPNLIYSKLYPTAILGLVGLLLGTFYINLFLHVTCEERDESHGGLASHRFLFFFHFYDEKGPLNLEMNNKVSMSRFWTS